MLLIIIMRKKMKNKHLKFWEENCSIEKFKSWCHKDTEWKKFVLDFIITNRAASVLDIGCGTAHMGEKLKQLNPNIKYVGTEITEKFVQHNIENGFDCVYNDLSSLPFKDNEIDVTICLDVINHQLEYENKIKEMMRVTKKHLIISFFKSWDTNDRIINKGENLIYHHFDAQGYDYKFSINNSTVKPKILIISKGEKK